jgi:hypothetical protein
MRLFTLLLLFACNGCTTYEYDITRPADMTGHITAKADTTIQRDPLIYHFRADESRLVVSIENPTDDAVQLLGDRSTVVDFGGQSHPLQSRAAAPHSFVKLILPPFRPTYERTGPSIGIGIGTMVGTRDRYRGGIDDDPLLYNTTDAPGPQYLTLVDTGDAVYWDWSGEGEIRLSLVFQSADKEFTHDWVIRRVKKT